MWGRLLVIVICGGSLLVIKLYVGEPSGYKVICGGSLLVIKLYVGESSGYKVICGGVFWL